MAGKIKFTQSMWQEWKRDPQKAARQWGIDWAEWEQTCGMHDWKNMSMDEFEKLVKKSRWAGMWDWAP